MDAVWVAVVAFAGGSVVALLSAYGLTLLFHPVLSVRLDEKKGSLARPGDDLLA